MNLSENELKDVCRIAVNHASMLTEIGYGFGRPFTTEAVNPIALRYVYMVTHFPDYIKKFGMQKTVTYTRILFENNMTIIFNYCSAIHKMARSLDCDKDILSRYCEELRIAEGKLDKFKHPFKYFKRKYLIPRYDAQLSDMLMNWYETIDHYHIKRIIETL